MNSTITLGQGSSVRLSAPKPFGCTDVFVHLDENDGGWTKGVGAWALPIGADSPLQRFVSRVMDTWDPAVTLCSPKTNNALASLARSCEHASRIRMIAGGTRGSAGSLRDSSVTFAGGTILVVDGAVWLDDDLTWMLRQHRAAHNALTVFCASIPMTLRGASLSHVEPVSIYCCEPDVVDFVAATGSQDIAAHLIPALQKAGRRVGVVTLRGETREICNWPSYLSVVGQALKSETPNVGGAYEQIAPGVWRHPEADVSANARIVGPVLIDRGCRIEPGAVVVGPTILGPGCVVEAQARIVRTVALGETIFPIRPVVSDRLIMHDTSAVDESSIAEHGRNAAGTPEVTVPAGPASRHGVWITVLVAVLVLAWALSGNAANVWHAWSQSGSLTVG